MFPANIYGPLNRGMAIQLCPGSFYTKKLCSRLYSIKVEAQKNRFL